MSEKETKFVLTGGAVLITIIIVVAVLTLKERQVPDSPRTYTQPKTQAVAQSPTPKPKPEKKIALTSQCWKYGSLEGDRCVYDLIYQTAYERRYAAVETLVLDVHLLAEDKYGNVIKSPQPILHDILINLNEVRKYNDVNRLRKAGLDEVTYDGRGLFGVDDEEQRRLVEFLQSVGM